MGAFEGLFSRRVSRREAIRQVAAATVAGVALTALPVPSSFASTLASPMDQGKSVTIALASEPNTFDPHLTVGRNTQIFVANVFDGLTARDGSGQLTPALATDCHTLSGRSGNCPLRPDSHHDPLARGQGRYGV